MGELLVNFFAQVVETIKVIAGMANAVFCLTAPLLVLGDARSLFQVDPQLFGLRLDETGNHALLDNGVATRPKTRTEENIANITAATTHIVQGIFRLPISGDFASDRYFGISRVFPTDRAIRVVEDQFNRRLPHGFSRTGTGEDDIVHRFATKMLGGRLTHDPTYGIDGVGLATTIWADDANQGAGKFQISRIDE